MTRVPTSIGMVVILITAFFAFEIIANRPVPNYQIAPQNVSEETAIVASVFVTPTPTTITPDLLPHVSLTTKSAKSAVLKKAPVAAPTKTSAPVSTVMTAQSVLDATTMTLREERDGPYEVIFTTTSTTGANMTWGLNGGLSAFSTSYSCDPEPTSPLPGAIDMNPMFDVRTSYNCTVSLAATTGSDLSTKSKQFSFATPAGQLVVTPPASMVTILHDDENDGGFVFNNEDAQPVTITNLTIDASYTALDTSERPLLLRPVNPTTGLSFGDYHLETLVADPSVPYTYAGTNITIPISLTLKPKTEKMLPIEILGVHRLSILGTDPAVTITLRGVTTSQGTSGGKTVIASNQISWSCIVPLGGYDPNATSGPFITGQACQQ
jgi:hypothetical protein